MVSRTELQLELIREKLVEIYDEETTSLDVRLRELGKELEKIGEGVSKDFEECLIELRAELESLRESPTWLEIFGVERRERSHSHFLGWLLDPRGSHGLGTSFLDLFLKTIARKYRQPYENFKPKEVTVELEKSGIESIADILITGTEFVCVVENKIRSREGHDQTDRLYRDFGKKDVKHEFFVYLTPYEEKPGNENFVTLSYWDIKRMLESLHVHGETALVVNEYLRNLEVNILEEFKEFGRKSELYFKNRDIFNELSNAWKEDMRTFFDALYNKLEKQEWVKSDKWTISGGEKYLILFKGHWLNKNEKGIAIWLDALMNKPLDETLVLLVYLEKVKNREKIREVFMELPSIRKLKKQGEIEVLGSDATLIRAFLPLKFGDGSIVDSTIAELKNFVERVTPSIDKTVSKVKIS